MILSITIGAAGLHFIDIINGSIQQGYYLETSLRIGKNADINDLALSNETNSIIQLSMPTKASGAVDSREDDEEHQLDSAVAVLENTGTSASQSVLVLLSTAYGTHAHVLYPDRRSPNISSSAWCKIHSLSAQNIGEWRLCSVPMDNRAHAQRIVGTS